METSKNNLIQEQVKKAAKEYIIEVHGGSDIVDIAISSLSHYFIAGYEHAQSQHSDYTEVITENKYAPTQCRVCRKELHLGIEDAGSDNEFYRLCDSCLTKRKFISTESLDEAATKYVFEDNGHKWSNNNNECGDNYGSFISGANFVLEKLTHAKSTKPDYEEVIKELEGAKNKGCAIGLGDMNKGIDKAIEILRSHSVPNEPTFGTWISVEERLPEAETSVLVSTANNVFRAKHIPKHFMDDDSDYFTGDLDYKEENDTYYWPEGFYEWNLHEDTHWMIQNVTHWMPLPSPPTK